LGLKRVREGNIFIKPGYDGLFGQVNVWPEEELGQEKSEQQMNLF